MPVVDTSIALKWLVFEDGSAEARRLLVDSAPGELAAPALILVETHYVMTKRRLNGLVSDQQLNETVDVLSTVLRIEPVDVELARMGASLSLEGNGSRPFNIYDCCYIALALRLQQPLLTADRMQSNMARRAGVIVQSL